MRAGRLGAAVGLGAAAAVPLLGLDRYTMRLLDLGFVFVLLTAGFNFTLGYAGQLSLAHVGFFALGAYGVGLLTTGGVAGFWPALGLSVAGCVGAALVLGVPTVKLRTHYLALATLSFDEIVRLVLTSWKAVTRGTDGVLGIPPPSLLGWPVRGDGRWYYLLLAVTAALLWLAHRIGASRWGAAFAAMRQAEVAAEAMGVDTVRLKTLALALSAAYAAVAGGLYASLSTFISPEFFNIDLLVSTLAMLLIGGAGTVLGPVVGGLGLTFLPEWLRGVERYYMLAYGLGIVALITLFPAGIVGLAARLGRRPAVLAAPAARIVEPLPPAGSVAPAGVPLLAVRALTVRFGGLVAVDGLDFAVEAGRVHGLIGPNGAGKTTVINVLTGLYRPTAGSVVLGGRSLVGLAPHAVTRLGVARTFQTIRLFPAMSALANVMVAGQCHATTHLGHAVAGRAARREREALEAEARALLAWLGLDARADDPAGSLAHGQQRLLEIARALATRPRLLCLDEPAAGLTHGERAALVERLRALRERAVTLLVVEHNMPFIMQLCDTITVLDFGRKIAEGSPAAVRDDAAVVEAYLGSPLARA